MVEQLEQMPKQQDRSHKVICRVDTLEFDWLNFLANKRTFIVEMEVKYFSWIKRKVLAISTNVFFWTMTLEGKIAQIWTKYFEICQAR